MDRRHLILLCLLLLEGCAGDKAASPAQSASKAVSTFQADLSKFQTTVDSYKARGDDRTASIDLMSEHVLDDTGVIQTEWKILAAKDATSIFQILQQQGQQEAAGLLTVAAKTTVPTAPLPLDKLGGVSKSLDDIAKPSGLKADIETLIKYGNAVNADMKPTGSSTP